MWRGRRALVAVPLAVAVALGSAGALSGCAVGGLVREVAHGHVDLDGRSVPSDFPNAVPLVRGRVLYGASAGSSGATIWNVTIRVGHPGALDAVDAQLTGAGFQRRTEHRTDKGGTASFAKAPFSVLVVVARDDAHGWVANYTVTRRR